MSGRLRQGTDLSPTGRAAIDQTRIPFEASVRPQTQSLHDAGPEAFDQHVGRSDETERGLDGFGLLEIQAQMAPPAGQQVQRLSRSGRARPGDAGDLGAMIGKHHRGEGGGPEARELHDPKTSQRALCLRVGALRCKALG